MSTLPMPKFGVFFYQIENNWTVILPDIYDV